MQHGFEAPVMEVQKQRPHGRRRVGDGPLAQILPVGGAVRECVHIVLDPVLAEGGVGAGGEPPGHAPRSRQLDAAAVAVGHVDVQRVGAVVDHARMHQLILVLHVVEVHARTEPGRGVGVAQFVVV